MGSRAKLTAALAAASLGTAALAACGQEGVQVASNDPTRLGAVLFNQHCGGCHTLDVAGTEGSATKVRDREIVDGPDFNVRRETVQSTLYAIRNGGFSGAIMPANIVTGSDAGAIAKFLAKYSGRKASTPPAPAAVPSQSPSPQSGSGPGGGGPGKGTGGTPPPGSNNSAPGSGNQGPG